MKKLILILLITINSNVHSNLLSDDYTKSEETVNGERKLVLTYSKETIKAYQDEQLAYKNLTKKELLQNFKSVVSDPYVKFKLNIDSNSVSAEGITVPMMLGDMMNANTGPAIITIKRNKDGKSFNLFLNKVFWYGDKLPCVGMTDWEFDTDGCELKNKDNILIENHDEHFSYEFIINGNKKMLTTLISFHDIDNDGKKELLYTEHYPHRSGSTITAFNIINTKDQFELDENEPISIKFDATHSSEFKEEGLIEILSGGCCVWQETEWTFEENSFKIKSIKEYLLPDWFD